MNVVGRAVHGAIGLMILLALIVQVVLSSTIHGISTGTSLVRLFSYFTIESNMVVCASLLILALRPAVAAWSVWILRLDGLLGIAVTGVIYSAVLAGTNHPTGWAAATNLVFHYLAPILAVVAWLLIGPRPRIEWSTCLWALVWPLVWVAWTLVHGSVSHWYPYPFIDADTHGYPRVMLNVAVVAVILIVFATIFRLLDRVLPGDGARGSSAAVSAGT